MKVAILDDYQNVALKSADWDRLRKKEIDISVFHEAFSSPEKAAQSLQPFDILCLMRERTAFPRTLIEKLPNLKFISLTGLRAGSMDSKALGERGIPVSNTRSGNGTSSTAELTWGLIISAARSLENRCSRPMHSFASTPTARSRSSCRRSRWVRAFIPRSP